MWNNESVPGTILHSLMIERRTKAESNLTSTKRLNMAFVTSIHIQLAKASHMTNLDNGVGRCTPPSVGLGRSTGDRNWER